jgi:23S rRNA pseudouridine1911/1915/1917 synthase
LAGVFSDLSRARIKALIDSGTARVNGRASKPSRRLKGGEWVELVVPPPRSAQAVAQDLPLTILYEDRDLVVLDKPAGMVVHPAAGHAEGTLVNALLHRIRDLAGVGGELRPGIVHRLDKNTSGCMVVAKNTAALADLQQQFKARTVKKIYLALVHGQPPQRLTVETLFGRHPRHRKRFTGRVGEGKRAVTAYQVRQRFSGAALLEVEIQTGRTHQIRVHLAESGHPILGDALYGGSRRRGTKTEQLAQQELGRQALHAWKLRFNHPRTKAALAFEAQVPPDFERALAILRSGG